MKFCNGRWILGNGEESSKKKRVSEEEAKKLIEVYLGVVRL